MELSKKVKEICPNGESFAAPRDDGALGFHISFSKDLSSFEPVSEIEQDLTAGIKKEGVQFVTEINAAENNRFGSLKIFPSINGKKWINLVISRMHLN